LIERINVDIQGNTEYVEVDMVWAGGFTSRHQILRPVLAYEQLRDFDRLVQRTRQLREIGQSAEQIAQQLNAEGFHPTGGKSSFAKNIVRQILPRWQLSGGQKGCEMLGPGEWRLSDLARQLCVHPSKLRRWCRRGWVPARRPLAVWSYIIWADHEEIDRLRRLRDHAEAHPFGRYPVALTSPTPQPAIPPPK
jgi:DNA-binding transcriptional MerR regulator